MTDERDERDERDQRDEPHEPHEPHEPLEPLASLQARVDARGESRVSSDRWAAHEAVLDRLAANVRVAETYGWTSCAIERLDGATHFSAWGVPPGDCKRHAIPDWSSTSDPNEQRRGE